jgi:hypothetical protein
MERSILANIEDARSIAEEECHAFVKNTLQNIGLPVEEVWPDISLTVEQKIALRNMLSKFDVEIVDDRDKGIKIYHERTLLAEWFKPRFVMRADPAAVNPSKKTYYEIVLKTWSMYEDEGDTTDEQD